MNSMFPFKKRENPLAQKNQNQKNEVITVREKYTATMEKELRKRLKIASIEKGIDVSQYIEEAVLDKLEREGF